MDWLSLLIGALVGWLVCWLIDLVICRRRRVAAEKRLQADLQGCREGTAALEAQLAGSVDLQDRLDGANAEIATLQARLAGMGDLEARLDRANTDAAALQRELGAMKELQERLDGAHGEIAVLKGQLAEASGLEADRDSWRSKATGQGLEIERLKAELASGWSAAKAGAAGGAAAAVGAVAAAGAEAVDQDASVRGVENPVARASAGGVDLSALEAETPASDDLTLIEGIGPKINSLLNQGGIYTFGQLAAAGADLVRGILEAAGPRYRLADPSTWAEQAALARDGQWDALKAVQDSLRAGRQV